MPSQATSNALGGDESAVLLAADVTDAASPLVPSDSSSAQPATANPINKQLVHCASDRITGRTAIRPWRFPGFTSSWFDILKLSLWIGSDIVSRRLLAGRCPLGG
jgi:hypothetical protein